jgi:hypothetical protein
MVDAMLRSLRAIELAAVFADMLVLIVAKYVPFELVMHI